MSLIDREAARREIVSCRDKRQAEKGYGWEWEYNGFNHSVLALGRVPAVDAAIVVRCKDCRHGHTAKDKYGEYLYCDISGEDNYDPDFYCANGERREEQNSG